MVVLFDIPIWEKVFSDIKDSISNSLLTVLYNENIKVCLSRGLVDLIEKSIDDSDLWQFILRKLSDDDRLIREKTDNQTSFCEQFVEIYKKGLPFLLPITLDIDNEVSIDNSDLIILNNAKKVNKDWLVLEVLSKGICNVCYSDFRNDNEIGSFFEDIFSLNKDLGLINIFNREQDSKFLEKVKGCKIYYHTLIKGIKYNFNDYKDTLFKMRKELTSNKLTFFYTSNPRELHERKIIFDGVIITIDNSLNNLTIKEPTWEITISYDPDKAHLWLCKGRGFCKFKA